MPTTRNSHNNNSERNGQNVEANEAGDYARALAEEAAGGLAQERLSLAKALDRVEVWTVGRHVEQRRSAARSAPHAWPLWLDRLS